MPSNAPNEAGRLFLAESIAQLRGCREKIEHCLAQLDDEQTWWRSRESGNSIGNLLLHLGGNLTQWIVAAVGGAEDARDRPREFSERGPIPKQQLLTRFGAVIEQAASTLQRTEAAELVRPRRVQGFDVTVLSAVYQSVSHLSGHTQEIVFITRLQLGDRYRFHWTPGGPEQGAAAD